MPFLLKFFSVFRRHYFCCSFRAFSQLVSFLIILENEYGKGAVFGFFHNDKLFSTATYTKLIRESDCHETAEDIECPADAKYRRSDGRCTNLKYPIAGAAGEPYIRLTPAVSVGILCVTSSAPDHPHG